MPHVEPCDGLVLLVARGAGRGQTRRANTLSYHVPMGSHRSPDASARRLWWEAECALHFPSYKTGLTAASGSRCEMCRSVAKAATCSDPLAVETVDVPIWFCCPPAAQRTGCVPKAPMKRKTPLNRRLSLLVHFVLKVVLSRIVSKKRAKLTWKMKPHGISGCNGLCYRVGIRPSPPEQGATTHLKW